MTPQEKEALLKLIDISVLRKFAAIANIPIPQAGSKDEIIQVLLRELPTTAPDPTRAIIELELKEAEARIEDSQSEAIQELREETEKESEKRLSQLKQELENWFKAELDSHEKLTESRLNWINDLKGVFQWITGLFAAFTVIAGVLGGVVGWNTQQNLQDNLKKVEDTRKKLQETAEEANKLEGQAKTASDASRNTVLAFVASRCIEDCDGIMRDLSYTVLPADKSRILIQIRDNRKVLSQLEKALATSGQTTDEDRQLVQLLANVYEGLDSIVTMLGRDPQELKTDTSGERKSEMAATQEKWIWISNYAITPDSFESFRKHLAAYAHNVLGYIALKRYRVFQGVTGDLEQAEQEFKASYEAYPEFGRAYSNHGVVLLERFRNQKNQKMASVEAAKLLETLHNGQDLVARSLAYTIDPRAESISRNNLAIFYYEEALLLDEHATVEDPMNKLALEKLKRAEEQIQTAEELEPPIHPVVYATDAEVRCVRLKFDEKKARTDGEKREELKAILDLVKLAREKRYSFGSRATILEYSPTFEFLSILDPEYKEKLYEAAGVN